MTKLNNVKKRVDEVPAAEASAVEDIQAQIDALVARADELEAKAGSEEGLTPEETTELEGIVAKLAELGHQRTQAELRVKLAEQKAALRQPTTAAPKIPAQYKRTEMSADEGEAITRWMQSHFGITSPDSINKMAAHGITAGSNSLQFSKSGYANLNKKAYRRTKMNTGGSGVGAEWLYKTYSSKVVEYLNYNSPFVAALSSEVVPDGVSERSFGRIDPTALKSTKITASGGSETNPTIPEVTVASSKVLIKPFTVTSGRFVVTREMALSTFVPFIDRLSGFCGDSDAAYIEDAVLNETGTGSDGSMQGLMDVAQAFTPVTGTDTQTILEEMYFKIPKQYRDEAILVANDASMAQLVQDLKDNDGRSLFSKDMTSGAEFDVFLGKKFHISRFMPDNMILYFVPSHYQLVFGNAAELVVFKERYWPDRAVAQVSMVSGAYIGPTGSSGTVWSYDLSSGS